MEIEGVTEVISFDETSVILRTLCGEMSVEGSDMKIGTLDTDRGVVTLSGRVDAVYYSADTADEKKSGFFGNLWKYHRSCCSGCFCTPLPSGRSSAG